MSERPIKTPTGSLDSTSERLLAIAVELSSRVAAARSLDEIFFLLTNDLRALAEFDRCLLITHLGGRSTIAAATHQPVLDPKSPVFRALEKLSTTITSLDTPNVLGRGLPERPPSEEEGRDSARAALRSYLDLSGAQVLCCIPLASDQVVPGHLIIEYHKDHSPRKDEIAAVVKISPVFASALLATWTLASKPGILGLVGAHSSWTTRWKARSLKYVMIPAVVIAATLTGVLFIPVPFSVGGETIIEARDKYYAFCKVDGLIERVEIRYGSRVTRGQTLAVLDGEELTHKIKKQKRSIELLSNEMERLHRSAVDDPSKLAERELIELKRKSARAELDFLLWQQQFLTIPSPADGVVVTKEVEALAGKRFEAGQPFCEISRPEDLRAFVYVPEDRILFVREKQPVSVYLNNNPLEAYQMEVDEISPGAEVHPRLGNVFRVTAVFSKPPPSLKVGMKGVGKIRIGMTTIWKIVTSRLAERWHQVMIHF